MHVQIEPISPRHLANGYTDRSVLALAVRWVLGMIGRLMLGWFQTNSSSGPNAPMARLETTPDLMAATKTLALTEYC